MEVDLCILLLAAATLNSFTVTLLSLVLSLSSCACCVLCRRMNNSIPLCGARWGLHHEYNNNNNNSLEFRFGTTAFHLCGKCYFRMSDEPYCRPPTLRPSTTQDTVTVCLAKYLFLCVAHAQTRRTFADTILCVCFAIECSRAKRNQSCECEQKSNGRMSIPSTTTMHTNIIYTIIIIFVDDVCVCPIVDFHIILKFGFVSTPILLRVIECGSILSLTNKMQTKTKTNKRRFGFLVNESDWTSTSWYYYVLCIMLLYEGKKSMFLLRSDSELYEWCRYMRDALDYAHTLYIYTYLDSALCEHAK